MNTAPHYVYELIDADGVHLYIGVTCHIANRLRDHMNSQEWWPEVDRIEVSRCADERSGRDLERALIETVTPKYNSVFTPRHDAGGWKRRTALVEAAHAKGESCGRATCAREGCGRFPIEPLTDEEMRDLKPIPLRRRRAG